MASYNRVILVGNLTRDPQMSYLPNQTAVAELGLAVNRRWRDAQGNNKDEVCFIDCRVYGKQAEVASQYLTKGKQVLVEGRLQFASWEGKDGTKRSKHRVIVERFVMLGAPGQGGAGGGAPAPAARRPMAAPAPEGVEGEEIPEPPYEGEAPPSGEDIPF